VQARQRVQLTGTNSSIGLIALIFNAHQQMTACFTDLFADNAAKSDSVFRRPGGFSEEPVPDPIPNSAVKLLSANGSSSQDARE
jgi:hypothetical protein